MATSTGFNGQRARPARNARYLLASSFSLALWYGINFWPGWDYFPVLSPATREFHSLVDLWLLAWAVSSAVYIVFDAKWFKSGVQVFVTTLAVAVAARAYTEFPFDFSMFAYYDFRWLARLALSLAVAGGLIRLVVVAVRFVRATMRAVDDRRFARQVRDAIEAKTYMAALARPGASHAYATETRYATHATWGDASDSMARTIAEAPEQGADGSAHPTLSRFAELEDGAQDAAARGAEGAGVGETRRSRRAQAAPVKAKLQLPRLGRRKVGSHAAR